MLEGIIYRILPYKESSKLLYVITPVGKVTLIASGVQKTSNPNRIIAQYLTKLSFEKNDKKDFYYLKNPVLVSDYQAIKDNYSKIKYVGVVLEAIARLEFEKSDYDFIYRELTNLLGQLENEMQAYSFLLKMLAPLGLIPNLSPNGQTIKGFSISQGRLIYEDELENANLNIGQTITLLEVIKKPYEALQTYDSYETNMIKQLVIDYYSYHLQIIFKTI